MSSQDEMDMMDTQAQFFSDDAPDRELPPCDAEHLEEILTVIKMTHPTVHVHIMDGLLAEDGAYIAKLLDIFDVCEMEPDRTMLQRIFAIFVALMELCDRRILDILLSDEHFTSVIGVFGYNPQLLHEIDFRPDLEAHSGFKQVIPFRDSSVVARVHMNHRILLVRDCALSRSLPDNVLIMLDHIVNENNYHILSFIADTEDYQQELKRLIRDPTKHMDAMRLLREIIELVRITRPLDRFAQRREGMLMPPVFGTLLSTLFEDGDIFEALGAVLGSPDSLLEDVELGIDVLNLLVLYQGPERLRSYLASEGKSINPPSTDHERLAWKPGSSLFTALLYVFEHYEPSRAQMFALLKEVFRVSLPQDDKFLNVLYPRYMHWLLQPLKYSSFDDEAVLFALQDSIMELLTFCTETHGYRIKYLFGRQPIASFVTRMLQAKSKLFVIHAVKFVRACAARGEAFFSRFLIQHNLFAPIFAKLTVGSRNACAVSSAILELLAYIESNRLTALVEHIYKQFYDTYKNECPIVFEAIRAQYEQTGSAQNAEPMATDDEHREQNGTVLFVPKHATMDDEEERYWEKDEDMDSFVPSLGMNGEKEQNGDGQVSTMLVDYPNDDHSSSPLKEAEITERLVPRAAELSLEKDAANGDADDEDLRLPVRQKDDDVESGSFLGGGLLSKKPTKKVKSPQYKAMFEQITWKTTVSRLDNGKPPQTHKHNHDCSDSSSCCPSDVANPESNGDTRQSTSPLVSKRRLSVDEEELEKQCMVKKAKATCTPVTSS